MTLVPQTGRAQLLREIQETAPVDRPPDQPLVSAGRAARLDFGAAQMLNRRPSLVATHEAPSSVFGVPYQDPPVGVPWLEAYRTIVWDSSARTPMFPVGSGYVSYSFC